MTLQVANEYIETAVRSLDEIPSSDSLDSLLALTEYVQSRNY
jgi:geranylgeranyl pyrophosphate synthase